MTAPREKTARRFLRGGFTMLELLVSTVVLITIITLLARALTQTETVWDRGQSRMRLLASGRAALNVIRDDLESAFATNVFLLVGDDVSGAGGMEDYDVPSVTAAQAGYEIDPTYGFGNRGLFFYRFSAMPRKGCYPVEAVCFSVTNAIAKDSLGRDYELPVLVRHDCRFKIVTDEPHDDPEDEAWEDEDSASTLDDGGSTGDMPAGTRLQPAESMIVSSTRLLEGVAAFYCLPYSITASHSGSFDATPDCVDVFLELLTPSQCRRAYSLSGEKQKEFVEKNALRLSARFAIGARPAFNFPENIATPWEVEP